MINFGILGALGRMGKTIANCSLEMEGLECVAGFDNPKHPNFDESKTLSVLSDGSSISVKEINKENSADLGGIIDFSLPPATMGALDVYVENKLPLVIGTTGFSPEELKLIEKASKSIPVLMATNMSLGVNMLFALTEMAAKGLIKEGFHPEITEIHHKHKKDAPSGTAKTLEEIIKNDAGYSDNQVVYGREGQVGERPDKQLGVFALRGGDVVGDHTVFFLGNGERIELKHQAVSRDTFAMGALNALKFIVNQSPGLYNMRDVLNL